MPIFAASNRQNRQKMNFWKHFWYLLITLGVGLVVCVGLQMVLVPLLLPQHQVVFYHAVQWSQNLFLMIGAPLLWTWYIYVRGCAHRGTAISAVFDVLQLRRVDVRMLALTLFLMIASVPVLDALEVFNSRLPLSEGLRAYAESESVRNMEVLRVMLQPNGVLGWIALIALMSLATAVGEEVLFRGAMLQCLLRDSRINHHVVAWLVGLIFALIHFELLGLLPRWLLGTLFVYLVYWSRSLWPAIMAHALNNLLALISYKTASPQELLQTTNKDYGFSPLIILLSAVATAAILWQMSRSKDEKVCC